MISGDFHMPQDPSYSGSLAIFFFWTWSLLMITTLPGCGVPTADDTSTLKKSSEIQPAKDGIFHVYPGKSLQQAADAAALNKGSKTVRVHAGNYFPRKSGQVFLSLTAKHDGVTLEAEGDVTLHGSHSGEDAQAGTIDDIKVNHVVYFGDGISSKTVFRGFRITGGQPGNIPNTPGLSIEPRSTQPALGPGLFFYLDGSAIKIFGRSSPHIVNAVIEDNESALCGGGVSVEQRGLHDQPVRFTTCIFRDNRCPATGSAIDLLEGSKAVIENCLFVNNIGNYGMDKIQRKYGLSYNSQHGTGALTVFPNSKVEVLRCTFTGNWNGVDDHGRGSIYRQSIFWMNDAVDSSNARPDGPFEFDILDASGVSNCWIGGGLSDLRGTIDASRNRLDAPPPQFDDNIHPQHKGLVNLGFRREAETVPP